MALSILRAAGKAIIWLLLLLLALLLLLLALLLLLLALLLSLRTETG